MSIEIRVEDHESLSAYATVSSAFDVREVIDVAHLVPGLSHLPVRLVPSRAKDYDALPNNSPLVWPSRFDTSAWIFLAAYLAGERLGGAIIVTEQSEVALLGGRPDGSVIWDVRVATNRRRDGIGHALLFAAEAAARQAGRQHICVETQDSNVPACRLYAANGYSLTKVVPDAYGADLREAQLIWIKTLV